MSGYPFRDLDDTVHILDGDAVRVLSPAQAIAFADELDVMSAAAAAEAQAIREVAS